MAVFSYKAIGDGRGAVSGILVADSPRQARDQLRNQGLTIQEISHQAAGRSAARPGGVRPRQTARVAAFVREISTLLGAGIPLLDAIDAVAGQHRGAFGTCLALLRDRVAGGAGLAAAMAEQPAVFDELCTSMVEVGEQAGALESVLSRLADFKERSLRFKNKVLTALLYPSFVFVMAMTVGVGLMTVVLPKLLDSLTESGRPLPWATRVVKAASDFFVDRGWVLIGSIAVIVVAGGAAVRREGGRLKWDHLKLRLPVVGPLLRKQAIARVAALIATMMRSGVVFLKALEVARRTTDNRALRAALEACGAAVRGGREISEALADAGEFPPIVVRLFSVGQQSGRMEEMLERLATDYDQQVTLATERLTAVLEPLLVLLLVGLVAVIAFATVLPLLEAADVL